MRIIYLFLLIFFSFLPVSLRAMEQDKTKSKLMEINGDPNIHLLFAIEQMDPIYVKSCLARCAEPDKAFDDDNNNGIHLLFQAESSTHLKTIAKLILPFAGNCWYKENKKGELPLDYFDAKNKHKEINDLVIDLAHYFSWNKFGHIFFESEPKSQSKRLNYIQQLMTSKSELYQSKIKEKKTNRSKTINDSDSDSSHDS